MTVSVSLYLFVTDIQCGRGQNPRHDKLSLLHGAMISVNDYIHRLSEDLPQDPISIHHQQLRARAEESPFMNPNNTGSYDDTLWEQKPWDISCILMLPDASRVSLALIRAQRGVFYCSNTAVKPNRESSSGRLALRTAIYHAQIRREPSAAVVFSSSELHHTDSDTVQIVRRQRRISARAGSHDAVSSESVA